jgi:hypothetical protein
MSAKLACTMAKRGSAICRAAAMASGSLVEGDQPAAAQPRQHRALWPPRPKVPST